MGSLFSYSLSVAILLWCGYVVYKSLFASERQHGYNRALIYSIYIFSLILPLILYLLDFSLYKGAAQGGIEIGELTHIGTQTDTAKNGNGWSFQNILLGVYAVGIVGMVIYSLAGAVALWRIVRKGEKRSCDGYTLVINDDERIAPFSWLRYVVINRSDLQSGADVILTHEKRHLELHHWIDLLFAQIVLIFQWFNPAAWLLREEFQNVHEFQADEAVMTSGADMKEYQMLLIKKAVGTRFQSLANSLNHSKLKKRITMMYKEKSSGKRRLGALLLVPAMAVGCMLVQIPAFAGFLDSESKATLFVDSDNKVSEKTPNISMEPAAKSKKAKTSDKVYQAVEELAEPEGGMKGLMDYLSNSIKYPEEAAAANIEGRVIVRFVVGKDGFISDAQIMKGVDPALDKEAIRVVEQMPRWTPAKVNGEVVASYYTLPVSFKLQSDSAE